jgi:phosphopantetheine adenylyltransferase
VFISSFLIFLGYFLTKNIFEYQEKVSFYKQMMNEKNIETKKTQKLNKEIARNQDVDQIEKNIRQKLNLLKENEIAVILPNISITPTIAPIPPKTNPQLWFELLLSK